MCSIIDSDGMSTLLRESKPIARKTHKCFECQRQINIGERYVIHITKFDGSLDHYKRCAQCDEVCHWLALECGGYLYRGVEDDLHDHARDSHYGWPVKRAYIGMKLRWRTPSGKLMPPPDFYPELKNINKRMN